MRAARTGHDTYSSHVTVPPNFRPISFFPSKYEREKKQCTEEKKSNIAFLFLFFLVVPT